MILGNEINAVEIIWFRAWYFIKVSHAHMLRHKSSTSQHTTPLPSNQLLKLSLSNQDMTLENVAARENVYIGHLKDHLCIM